jgi:5-methylcytosine-specific restriction protein A
MPTAPSKPCRQLPCAALTTDGFCTAHQQHKNDRFSYRGTSASRGYDNDWKKLRVVALQRDCHLCQICLKAGRATPAQDVHHILSIELRPDLRLDIDNLLSVCRPCHAIETATEKHAAGPIS